MNCRRGEIYFIDKFNNSESVDSEQRQGRPYLVISPNRMIVNARGALCVPLTLQEKVPMATHCKIEASGKTATVLCEQIRYIDEQYFASYNGTATDEEMAEVEKCILAAVGISSPDTPHPQLGTDTLSRATIKIQELERQLKEKEKEIERLKIKEEAYISLIKST